MQGWSIVCPDRKDAEFDAGALRRRGQCSDGSWNHGHGECPDPSAEHTVEPRVFAPPQPTGES
jgi:hypothetical protein